MSGPVPDLRLPPTLAIVTDFRFLFSFAATGQAGKRYYVTALSKLVIMPFLSLET